MSRSPMSLALAATACGAFLLAGCTGGVTPSGQPDASAAAPASTATATTATATTATRVSANDADVMFTQMMIPHHEQAVEMSDILLAKPGLSTEMTDLATAIRDAQQPEIDQMRGWLQAWGEPEGGQHGGHAGMQGMLTEAELGQLRSADTLAASGLFLDQMIAHHEGAVAMAEQVLADGADPAVRQLAQDVVSSQREEIELMRELRVGF
ncbi:MAG: DUF305 domain-containing protein [Propionibacteriaceae bacterium]|nr:DUF305 domain-containing protein [Propionibacteriaceae bacterium]